MQLYRKVTSRQQVIPSCCMLTSQKECNVQWIDASCTLTRGAVAAAAAVNTVDGSVGDVGLMW